MTDYTTLHNVMQHYTTLYKAIRYYTMLIIQDYTTLYKTIQGESKKTDTFDIQMNNKGVSFF